MGSSDDLIGIGILVLVIAGGYYVVSSGALSSLTPSQMSPSRQASSLYPTSKTRGGRQVTTTRGTGGGGAAVVTGRNIYPVVSRINVPNPAGANQSIH